MKISNKEKDYISIILAIVFFAGIIWLLTGAVLYVKSLFAEDLQNNINKYLAEQQIQQEIRYLELKNYIDNMSEEEFNEIFYKENINEI